jgi:hypothetical protein
MATQLISTFNTMLKEHWLPPLQKEFNLSTVLLERMRRKSVKAVGGEYYLYPIHTQRNEAIGPRGENAVLPGPSYQTYNQAKIERAAVYGRFQISGWVLAAAKGDDTAIDALNGEMVGIKQQMSDEVNRLLYGIGSSKITNPNADAQSGTTINVRSTRNLRAGQEVCFAARSDGTTGSEMITVVTIASTTSITCDSVSSTATTDGIYPGDVNSNWSAGDLCLTYNQAFTGLDGIIDDANPDAIDNARHGDSGDYSDTGVTDYGNIDRASVDSWKGNVLAPGTNAVRNVSIDLMMEALHACQIDGGNPSLIVTNHELWRRYGMIMNDLRNWQGNVKMMDGGWRALDFVGIPVVADKACPDNTMFFLDLDTFDILEEEPLGFMDADGQILVRDGSALAAYDRYEGTATWRGALGCNKPNANCKIEALSHTLV